VDHLSADDRSVLDDVSVTTVLLVDVEDSTRPGG